MENLVLGGLKIQEELEQVPFAKAITASDLYLDRNSIRGRNGYRTALATAPGTAGDNPQGLWRHRGSPTSKRMLGVLGGKVFCSNASPNDEPSTELLSDMTMATLGTPFGASGKISGCQLHKHFYLGTDESNVAMRRVKFTGTDTYALESLEVINQPARPLATKGTLAWSAYRAMVTGATATATPTNCAFSTTVTGLLSGWYGIVGTGGDATQPLDGAKALVTLNTAQNMKSADWLLFAVSPPDSGKSLKSVVIEISADNSIWKTVGTITDRPPTAGSPNLIFCSITAVSDTIKAAVKYIRFTVNQNGDANTLRFAVYGHMVLPTRDPVVPSEYFISAFNPSTLQESPLSQAAALSDGTQVTITDSDITAIDTSYTDQFMSSDAFASTGASLNPFSSSTAGKIYNNYASPPLSIPSISQIGLPITISGLMPSGYAGNLTARLWKQTETGVRLVDIQATLAAAAAYSIIDNGGISTLANLLFKAQGTPPRCNAMCAKDGRVVVGYENALYVSSFVPLDTQDTNPFPQWPLIAQEDADGWNFTLDGGGSREQIQTLTSGDRVYIGTNERMLYLSGTQPNAPYYECSSNGVVSRRAAMWVKQGLIWASWDGIYLYQPSRYGQLFREQNVVELSEEIRDYYWRTFLPDSTTVIEYQQGALYCWTGTRYIRYSFTTGRWTTGTTADTPLHSCRWYDVGSTTQRGQQMWLFLSNGSTHSRMIVRWQPDYTVGVSNAATSDAGTVIPAWSYSTGFYTLPGNALLKWLYYDVTEHVTATVEKTANDAEWFSVRGLTPIEGERAFPPNPKTHKIRLRLSGANTTVVRRLMYEVEPAESRGGGNG